MSYIARTQTKVKYTAVSRETKEPKFHVKLHPVRSPHATRRRQRVASTTRLCRSLGDTPGTTSQRRAAPAQRTCCLHRRDRCRPRQSQHRRFLLQPALRRLQLGPGQEPEAFGEGEKPT